MKVSCSASDQNGLKCEERTVETTSEQKRKKFCHRICCSKHKKHDRREPGLFKEDFRVTPNFLPVMCIKPYCFSNSTSQNYQFSSKGLNKHALKDSGDGSRAKNN